MATCTSTSRFGQIACGYFAASVVGGLVICFGLLPVLGPFALIAIIIAVPAAWISGLLPAAVLITYAERHSLRSANVYVGAGAAIGFVAALLIFASIVSGASGFVAFGACLGGAAGAIAGYVYHSIAGDAAGE